MDNNNDKLLQHKLKCKLCINKITNYDVDLYTNSKSEFVIYAQVKAKFDITFDILKEHKLFIPQIYSEKSLLAKIKDHNFNINNNGINETKLSKNIEQMQLICNSIIWEEIPVLLNKIVEASKSGKISINTLTSILDKLVSCSKKIDKNEINFIDINKDESLNCDPGKGNNMQGLTQENFMKTIDALKKANKRLKDD
jgi:hypothetical protein